MVDGDVAVVHRWVYCGCDQRRVPSFSVTGKYQGCSIFQDQGEEALLPRTREVVVGHHPDSLILPFNLFGSLKLIEPKNY